MDDLLKSVDTIQEASKLAPEMISLRANWGFNLTKFLSSNPEVLEKVAQGKRSYPATKGVSLDLSTCTIEKALGVVWCL